MKKQSYSFPSVYEAVGSDLSFVSKSLINGLQVYDEKEQAYIVGNLALTEGRSPNKLVNSSPHDIDYNLLLKSGLLLANENYDRPIVLTTGFPFSTYQVYKDAAEQMIQGLNSIKYNPGTYSNEKKCTKSIKIDKVEILPEMIGNIIALRVGEMQAEGNFFVVSLGYGTCEAVLSKEDGIVHRTSTSITGMQYAVDLFMRSLATKYYLGLKTEKQLDISFRNDHIILDRKKVDISDLRKRILSRYYKDIISMGLRKSFTDTDFESANRIYLTGGGALFTDLVDEFKKEFNEIAEVKVVNNPLTLTSEGYSLNSVMLANGNESYAIGLDIGNANTVLTQYEDEKLIKSKDKKEKSVENKPVTTSQKTVTESTLNTEVKNDSVKPDNIKKADKVIADKVIEVVDEIVKTNVEKSTNDNEIEKANRKEEKGLAELYAKEKDAKNNEPKKEIQKPDIQDKKKSEVQIISINNGNKKPSNKEEKISLADEEQEVLAELSEEEKMILNKELKKNADKNINKTKKEVKSIDDFMPDFS